MIKNKNKCIVQLSLLVFLDIFYLKLVEFAGMVELNTKFLLQNRSLFN